MSRIHAATFEVGIDAAQIPEFERIFKINNAQLFKVAVPRHAVTVSTFYIDTRLVTNAEYSKFTEANPEWRKKQISPALHNGNYLKGWADDGFPRDRGNHPVVNVSWYAAVAYCRWSGKRLPTEAEWEHAARGDLNHPLFPWGDAPADGKRANYSASGVGTTTAVASYPPNGYGLYDMAGNVWEYLADEWAQYSASPSRNPLAASGAVEKENYLRVTTRRVIRGGSFGGAPINLWLEYRDSHPPDGAREFVGFRCAKSAEEP